MIVCCAVTPWCVYLTPKPQHHNALYQTSPITAQTQPAPVDSVRCFWRVRSPVVSWCFLSLTIEQLSSFRADGGDEVDGCRSASPDEQEFTKVHLQSSPQSNHQSSWVYFLRWEVVFQEERFFDIVAKQWNCSTNRNRTCGGVVKDCCYFKKCLWCSFFFFFFQIIFRV